MTHYIKPPLFRSDPIGKLRQRIRKWAIRPTYEEVGVGNGLVWAGEDEVHSWGSDFDYYDYCPPEEWAAPPSDKSLLGIHAERLLADPVLHLAFDRVRDKLSATWAASMPADGEGRERCYMQLQGLERVRGELLAILGDRKVMEHASKEKEKRDERERERRAAA